MNDTSTTTPTAMLVHGAFADASGWSEVITALQAHGIPALAPPNPLRGLPGDAAYIAARARQVDGPVVLVGHSYGGAVVTVAGAAADNVVGLVYVAAFIPDEGESIADINARFPPSRLPDVIEQNTYPLDDGGTGVELTISAGAYPSVFAPSLTPEAAAAAAVSQRPFAARAFLEDRAGAAAWRTRPSWAIVAGADEAIHPDAERFMADRAGAETIEIPGPHTVYLSDPLAVARCVGQAVRACARPTAAAAR